MRRPIAGYELLYTALKKHGHLRLLSCLWGPALDCALRYRARRDGYRLEVTTVPPRIDIRRRRAA